MRLCAMVLASLLGASCASTSPSTPTTVSVTDTSYQGSWAGQTAQAQQITFTVSANLIATFRFDYSLTTPNCNGGGGVGGSLVGPAGASPMAAIANGAFTINFTTPNLSGIPAWTLAGTFTSGNNATGTLSVSASSSSSFSPSCGAPIETTWTAIKAP